MSPAPWTCTGWLVWAGSGCSLQHPPSASGKLKSPANLSGGMAALAAGARCPPAQGQRMHHRPLWLSLAGVSPVCCSGGREGSRAAPASCFTSLCFSLSLFIFFVPPPGICQADGADLCSGSAGQSQPVGCRGTLRGCSPSPPGIKAGQGDDGGSRWPRPRSQEGRRVLWRGGGVLCLEPNASRNCPSRLAAPQKRGFNPESSKLREPLRTPASLGLPGAERPPHPTAGCWQDGCCAVPSLPARGGMQLPGTPFPAQPPHRRVKKNKNGLV